MIRVSILGITGYAGIELLRLLNNHPEVEVVNLISHSNEGEKLTDIYPQFRGSIDKVFEGYQLDRIVGNSDLVFAALPHGISQELVTKLYDAGLKVIDLSGDFRYKNVQTYETWYNIEHKFPGYLARAVYGLVEINREEIKKAGLIANPGCYPTASILGLWPLVKEGLIDSQSIIIDAKSGVSGAGRGLKQTSMYIEVDENIKAYGLAAHRHTSEIEDNLNHPTGKEEEIRITFTPHLVPMKRGILATIYAKLLNRLSRDELLHIYRKYYPEDGFVHVLSPDRLPETKYVTGSNYCHLGFEVDPRTERIIILSAIDNLVKGAAGQAVQNMNVNFGLPEDMGLKEVGAFP